MTFIHETTQEVRIKIVYYGPPFSGKTTNLVKLREALATEGSTGQMVCLATETDRTLFFDFLPAKPASIRGFKVRIICMTAPGPVVYDSTRQLVLQDVDGVVFVADSQNEKMSENAASLENLREDLHRLKLNADELLFVLQYNKRDLPNVAAVERMEALLGNRPVMVPSFPAIANSGTGVLEAFNELKRLVLNKFPGGDDAAAAAVVGH